MRALATIPQDFLAANTAARDAVSWARALAVTGGGVAARDHFATLASAKSMELFERAAVAPGSITDPSFGGPISPVAPLFAAFLTIIRPKSVLGRLVGVKPVPFRVGIPRQTGVASAGWVGEGSPAPLSRFALDTLQLDEAKISAIIVLSRELAKSSAPDAAGICEAEIAAAITAAVDVALLDPSAAEVPGVSPASLMYGAPTVASTGATSDAFRADVQALLLALIDAGAEFQTPTWIMRPATLIKISLLEGIADLMRDGLIAGVPIMTSTNAPNDGNSPGDANIYLIDGSGVVTADAGLDISLSTQATLQMDDAPDDPTAASTVEVNLFQRDLVGLRATRYVTWAKRNEGVAGYISGVSYSA